MAPTQTSWLDKTGTRQRDKRGGVRPGAGRPKTMKRVGVKHRPREAFRPNTPLHVTLRIDSQAEKTAQTLRQRFLYVALRVSSIVASKFDDARIVHASIQGNHIHLIVEASNRDALSTMMKSFASSAAKQIKRAVRDKLGKRIDGRVFGDRYHVEILRTPAQVRHALSYVLNNWRKHGARMQGWRVDPYSTGSTFDGWRQGLHLDHEKFPPGFEAFSVWQPRTWLLTTGWRKHGLVSCYDKPGAPAFARTVAKRDERVRRELARERERAEHD